VVPARQPALLAAAVRELAADPAERARLASGAGEAAPRFSATRSEGEIEAVYRVALDRAALRSSGPRGRRRR